MKKIILTALLLILITLPTLLPYFNSKFFYTQDYIFIARLNQMSTALSQGQFPVRWAPDLRYGEPVFNYYAPLPYYLGFFIHLMGFNFLWVSKILFMLSAVLSSIAMYIFSSKLFSKKAGILSAVLYTYAPYKAVDMYVRGSLSETWAFVFFPLIFYSSYLLSKKRNSLNISFLGLSLAGLFLTHNVTTLMFLPFLGLWWIYLLISEKNWKIFIPLILGSVLGFGLAASFLLPASFERDFIQTKYLTVGYFDFRAHFVAFSQFFSTFWGYGSSLWGPVDGLSFQVGLVNWATLGLTGIALFLSRKDKKQLILISFLAVSFTLSIFLQHNKSAFIWEAFPIMAFIQFPWRFLAVSIFIVSIAGGVVAPYLRNRLSIVYFIIILAAVVSTYSYFKPEKYVDDSFFDKFLNVEKMRQGIDLTKDYLPIWVKTVDAPPLNYPESQDGKTAVSKFEKKGVKAFSQINVLTDSTVEVPITYFPNWEIKANNEKIKLEQPLERGLVRFKLAKGNYNVSFELKDTPVRMIGNTISLFSLLGLTLLLTFKKYKQSLRTKVLKHV